MDLLVKLSNMYMNCLYVIGRWSLLVKYSSISFSDFSHSSEFMFDLLAELDRDCIFAFLIVFSFSFVAIEEFMFTGESGGFDEDESEIGLLYVSCVGGVDDCGSSRLGIKDVGGSVSDDQLVDECS